MARPWPWLLLLLAVRCPALPTDPVSFPSSPEVTTLLRLTHSGVGGSPFPSLAPPITLLRDGKPLTLVVCLVLNMAAPDLERPIWFSAGNGSTLDAFTYSPSPAEDGTWTGLAQLSLSSEDLAGWETLVCHTGPAAGNHSWSTPPLQLSGKASSARTCVWEALRGTRGLVLRLGVLRLLLFKLLLLNVILTCGPLLPTPVQTNRPPPTSFPTVMGPLRTVGSKGPICQRCKAQISCRVHTHQRNSEARSLA